VFVPDLKTPELARLKRGALMPRDLAILACTECKRRNYTTTRNKKLKTDRIEIKKYCRFDRRHTLHREVK